MTGLYTTKFKCSLGDQPINALAFLKHIFQKEEQEEKVRMERIELLHRQATKLIT